MKKRWAILRWVCTVGAVTFALLWGLSLWPKVELRQGAFEATLSSSRIEFMYSQAGHQARQASSHRAITSFKAQLASLQASIPSTESRLATAVKENDIEAYKNLLGLVKLQIIELERAIKAQTAQVTPGLYTGERVYPITETVWVWHSPQAWRAGMPLAVPFGILTLAAITLWHPYFRRIKPFTCPKCNYSLTGLPPNSPCPECGKASPS